MNAEQILSKKEEQIEVALNELDPVAFYNFCYDLSNIVKEYMDGLNSCPEHDGYLWSHILKSIPIKEDKKTFSGVQFSTDGDVILCDNEKAAEIVADFLELIGYDIATTGIYDEERGTTWYYIDVE